MQVSVEKTSELNRKMTVNIPEEVIQEKMAERLKSLARDVKLDGFRPGKVPQHVVKRMYGERIKGEISGDLIQSTYYEALQEKSLRPAGPPHIHPTENTEGLEYVAEFEVYPEISIDEVEQISISGPISEVEESDIDVMIEKLREQKKDWQVVDRTVQEADRVTIDFSGVSEGENFTDGTAEDFQVEIGSKQMIPGFEDELIGLQSDAEKSFAITFPEDYGNVELAGKSAVFDIKVKKVEESVLPEINADFIKDYGIDDGELASFRSDVKANMNRELAQAIKGKLKQTVLDALYEKIAVNLPATLVDKEIDNLLQPYQERAKQQNASIEELNMSRDHFEDQAKRRVALGLIIAEIIQQNDIKVADGQVREAVEEMSKNYEKPEDVINWYYSDAKRLEEVEQMVLEDQTVAWLLEKVTITDEAVKFADLMNQGQ